MKFNIYTIVKLIDSLILFQKNKDKSNLPDFLNFEGLGTVDNALLNENSEDYNAISDKLYNLNFENLTHHEVMNSLKRAVITSFFTPDEIIDNHVLSLKNLAAKKNIQINTILEPSAGNGKYIKAFKKHFPNATIYALEKEPLTAKVLQYNFFGEKNIHIRNNPLEEINLTNFPQKFDLIASNIPFGSISVFDPNIDKIFTKQIHNYFIAKSVQLSHDNTLTSFITSKGFLDAKTNANTRAIFNPNSSSNLKASFIGAFRLPNHIFKNANTSVVTDIIYFQKGINDFKLKPSINSIEYNIFENTVFPYVNHINSYFKDYSYNVFGEFIPGGMYKKDDFTLKSNLPLTKIGQRIKELSDTFQIQKFNVDYSLITPFVPLSEKNNNINVDHNKDSFNNQTPVENINIPEEYKIYKKGHLYIKNNKTFIIKDFDFSLKNPLILSEIYFPKSYDVNHIAAIIELRNLYNKALLFETNNDKFKRHLDNFNDFYDQFAFQYDVLNSTNNLFITSFDIQKNDILNFETLDANKKYFVKSDVFDATYYIQKLKAKKEIDLSFSTASSNKKIVKSINYKDAISLSYNKYNKVNFDFLTKHLNISKQDIIDNAIIHNALFINPVFVDYKHPLYNTDKEVLHTEFVDENIFYSGHIQKKIDFYKNNDLLNYSDNLNKDYRTNVINNLNLVKPEIIPFEDLNATLSESWIDLNVIKDFIKSEYKVELDIKYNAILDRFFVTELKDDYSDAYYKLREDFTIRGGNGRTYIFENILEHNLNSLTPTINITISQKPKITKVDRVSILDFDNKKKSIDDKFYHYVLKNPKLKSNLEIKYYNLYNATLKPKNELNNLTFEDLQFTPYPVQKDAALQIIQNNGGIVDHKVGWGKTITAAMIAMKMKQMNIVKKSMLLALKPTINDIEKNIKQAYPNINILTAKKNSFTPKNIDAFLSSIQSVDWDLVLITHENYLKIKQNPEIQIQIMKKEIQNIDLDLEALGFNSYTKVTKQIKKGLEKRKENLEVKIKNLHHKFSKKQTSKLNFDELGIDHLFIDESHSFKNLAYTTRHNRVGGLNTKEGAEKSFNLLAGIRSLQKKYGADKGVTFLSGTTIANSITELYVLFKYLRPNKLNEMKISSFDQWVNVFGVKTLSIEKGMTGNYLLKERFRNFKKVPELASMYSQIAHVSHHSPHIKTPDLVNHYVTMKPYLEQKLYFKDLEEFAANPDLSLLKAKVVSSDKNLKKASSLIAFGYMTKASLDMRIVNDTIFDDHSQNRVRTVADKVYKIFKKTEHFKGTQLVFSDRSTPKSDFNIYDELKKVLTLEYGIEPNQIAFIHNYDEPTKKSKLIEDFNNGNVRILIGSTKKLGTGLNIQKRGVAIHHFDIPFRPSDFDQRIGRFVRKGNTFAENHYNDKVDNYLYATLGSIDLKLYDINNYKNTFIKNIKNNTLNQRTIDEGEIDLNGGVGYSDFVSLISDNDDFVKIQKLKKEKDNLLAQKIIYTKSLNNNKTKLLNLNANLESHEKILDKLIVNKKLFNEIFPEGKINIKDYDFYENNDDIKSIANKIRNAVSNSILKHKNIKSFNFTNTIANYKDLQLIYNSKNDMDDKDYNIFVLTPNKMRFHYGSKQLVVNDETLVNYPINSFSKIDNLIKNYNEMIDDTKKNIKALNSTEISNFSEVDEKRLNEIDNEIKTLEKSIIDDENKNRGLDNGKNNNKGKGI